MKPFALFLLPGQYAIELIFWFFGIQSYGLSRETYQFLEAVLALVIWCWVLQLCLRIVRGPGRSR